jgi:3-methyladenine DNA glycosylase AlkD
MAKLDCILIFNHLTPRLQELLYEAKKHLVTHRYKFCWAKGWAIFLRKTDNSRVIKLNTMQDLVDLQGRESHVGDRSNR